MKTIDCYSTGRDNNYNLLRFIAAVMVIFSHSFPLAARAHCPLGSIIQIKQSFGDISVNIFFVTSGFLVTKSLLARKGLISFFWARFLRIYPGLLFALLFCVFIIGISFTELPPSQYLAQKKTYTYLSCNLNLVYNHLQHTIPGVLTHVPRPSSLNGSLWTLPWEVWMYISLGLTGITGIIKKTWIIAVLTALFALLYFLDPVCHFAHTRSAVFTFRFVTFFYFGATFFLFKKYIAIGFLPLVILTAATVVSYKTPFFLGFFTIALVYAVFCFSYIPSGFIRNFNKLGDYSYGLYIYAFPIQQSLIALMPGIQPVPLFFAAFPSTLFFAIMSWHFIEKPAMTYKDKAQPVDAILAVYTSRLLSKLTRKKSPSHQPLPQPELISSAQSE